jgi:hypothetical protein
MLDPGFDARDRLAFRARVRVGGGIGAREFERTAAQHVGAARAAVSGDSRRIIVRDESCIRDESMMNHDSRVTRRRDEFRE